MKLRTLQRIALYLFFFSVNFEVWDPFHINLSTSKMAGFIYLFTILPDARHFFKSHLIHRFLNPLWIFFIMLTLISLINVNYISYTFLDFSIFQNIILLILLVNHERKEQGILEKGMLSFALGSICLAGLYRLGIGISYDGIRLTIFDDNQNNVGMRMAISLIVLIWVIVRNNFRLNRWRYLLFAAFPFMLMLMADTGSRVSFISFSLMFLVGMLLYKTKLGFTRIFVLLAGIALAYIFWSYISSSEVLLYRLTKTEKGGDLAGRVEIWSDLWPLISNHLIFGVGETGYRKYATEVFGKYASPHNVILEILCYTGITGLYFYLLMVFRALSTSFKNYKKSGALLPLLLFIPFFGLLLSGQLLVVKIGWVILAVGCSSIFSVIKAGKKKGRIEYHETSLCN